MTSNSNPSRSGPSASVHDSTNSDIRALISMMEDGISPKVLLNHLAPSFRVPEGADDMMLWRFIVSMIEPPRRKKLQQYNTMDDAINLINKSKKIVVLSGAGISTSAGLPDFRSRNGIYVQIHAQHSDLHDPKSMFDIDYFRKNPLPFYKFAQALYPGQYKPTVGHQFIKSIEDHNKLLRNYSQNIDTLEKQAGIKRVVECHGSFAKATCTNCKYTVDGEVIRADIMAQKIPICPQCSTSEDESQSRLRVMKPNIVFFGEQLGDNFHNCLESDKDEVDLLIVIGSSLKVRPVALIPKSIPSHVPQILINKEPLDHMGFDIELLGNCDDIIQELCLRLGNDWTSICKSDSKRLNELVDISAIMVEKGSNKTMQDKTDCNDAKEVGESAANTADKKSGPKGERERDNTPMASQQEEEDDLCSFKSNQANLPSEGTEQNMIEELDEISDEEGQDKTEKEGDEECAISTYDESSDEDWEDVEVLHSSSDSVDMYSRAKASIEIPDSSYLHLKPNVYLFKGVELTNVQLECYTKEAQSLSEMKVDQS